jgi:tetratricopeptide (TPR) repeat protein
MRKYSHLFAFMTLMALGFWSCKSFQGAGVTASPDPIEVHADSIKYAIKANIPPKSKFKKGGVYTGEAKIGSFSQGKIVVSSERYPAIKKTGMDTSVSLKRVYDDKMDGNNLMIAQKYERKGKSFELPPVENLAQCCITTSRLVEENSQYIWSKHDYKKEVPLSLEARFSFPKNVDDIQEGDYKKGDIAAIGDYLSKKTPTTKIYVEGFASPEGPYKRNVELAKNRLGEVQAWLINKLKEAGYTQYLDTTFFEIRTTSEDWAGFKKSIESQPYTAEVKKQILEIVSGGLTEDQREAQIMALVGGKDKVEHILAPLRRATIKVAGFEWRRTDAQIDSVAMSHATGKGAGKLKDIFKQEEWLYAISRMTKLNDKKVLLEAYRDAYPSDSRAFNDLGVIALMQNDPSTGLDYLDKASKLKSSDPAITNNLGVAYLKAKKYPDAKAAFEKALSARGSSPETNFNLGVVLERMGMYSTAIEKFNAAGSINYSNYNSGLCKLLMNDVNGSKASLNEAARQVKDHALTSYVMAIAGARSNDISTLSVNLKKACELDAALKAKAKKDLEFRKYWNNAEFKAAVN